MTKINWDLAGERYFENGVDRAVLYVNGSTSGVPWSGITSVNEDASGGTAQQYYYDGINYVNVASKEEYKATISAFSAPAEFDACNGNIALAAGFIATKQKRKSFGFSYRTKIGNDVSGSDYSYKIHLVYNALAAPSAAKYDSIGKTITPTPFSWDIVTKPIVITGAQRSAHIIIDASRMPLGIVHAIEDILYGTDSASPRLPLPSEISTLIANAYNNVVATNYFHDPSFEYGLGGYSSGFQQLSGSLTCVQDDEHVLNGSQSLKITSLVTGTNSTAGFSSSILTPADMGCVIGDQLTLSAWFYAPTGFVPYANSPTGNILGLYGTAVTDGAGINRHAHMTTDRDKWVQVSMSFTVGTVTGTMQPRIFSGYNANIPLWVDSFGISKGTVPVDFSGDTPSEDTTLYRWTGTPGLSSSQKAVILV